MSKDAYYRLKESLAEQAEHNNCHKTGILEESMKFEATSYNLEDLQMIAVRKFLLEEIARVYRITPHLLQELEHATFTNVTELGRQFVTYTLLPWCARWNVRDQPQAAGAAVILPFQLQALFTGRSGGPGQSVPGDVQCRRVERQRHPAPGGREPDR